MKAFLEKIYFTLVNVSKNFFTVINLPKKLEINAKFS